MSIVNQAILAEASQTFKVYFFSEIERMAAEMQPLVSLFALEMNVEDEIVKHRWMGDLPEMRQWVDEREIHRLSAEGFEVTNIDWEVSV